jgi:hypothetical protein
MTECVKCGKPASYVIITPEGKWAAVCEDCKYRNGLDRYEKGGGVRCKKPNRGDFPRCPFEWSETQKKLESCPHAEPKQSVCVDSVRSEGSK